MPRLERFDPRTASDADFEAYTVFINSLNAEANPGDPPRTAAFLKQYIQSIPPFVVFHLWTMWEDGAIIGGSQFVTQDREDNRHIGQAKVDVIPPWRTQGLARELLRPVLRQAQHDEKTMLISDTNSNAPSGEGVMVRLGGKRGMNMHTNQLELAELDRDLMARWRERGGDEAYELLVWRDRVPDDHLEAFAALKEVMNTAPFDDLELEPFIITPERIRQGEASRQASGERQWLVVARHRASGDLAGYTDLYWSPGNPGVLNQGDTAVVPRHRGKRLGRWLKAEMLETVIREQPGVHYVRTGNADSNDAMLNINREMGFKPYKAVTMWQLETDKLAAYLNPSG